MKIYQLLIISFFALTIISCQSDNLIEPEIDLGEETELEIPDWTETTHSKAADPDYNIVFPNDEVLRFDITISEENWSTMQADLDGNMNSGGPGASDLDFTPVWVPCSFKFNGIEWYKVGIRYKGNSSLRSAYNSNSEKFPFKLDFDEFEEEFPQIDNQRFYGFKQLNLGSNFSDASSMREKVAADLFREFGVPAARTSFCAVYLDRGNGSNFIGMFTLVEEVDNTVIKTQFDDDDANLYKPDGTGATFAEGSYNDSEMNKKTNENEADYSDIKALYDVLHSSNRTSNESQWKTDLENIFNVDRYLKYLAANTVIQNWDTYGRMTHNYFLYNDAGKLTWLPWDNNEAMQEGKMGGALSLSLSEVGDGWPMIRYIIDVEEYENTYKSYVREFTDQVYEPSKMNSLYTTYEALISSYANQENSGFSGAVSTLKTHVTSRNQAVDSYVD